MKHFFFRILFLLPFSCIGQEILTLEEAIAIALKENYDIQLVNNDLALAKNNVNRANAGMLPTVTGDFDRVNTLQNSTQTLLSGETRSVRGANNTSLVYGANLQWTIFDGFQMFARYEQLQELQKLGEATLKQQILDTVFEVISQYFSMVQQKKQLKALHTAMDLSKYRLEMAENRYQIGRASKLEVLAASVDHNTDTTNLMRQKVAYGNIKFRLNELMAREIDSDFEVEDTIVIKSNLVYEQLHQLAKQHNPELQAALISRRIAELQLKQVKGQRLPQVTVNSAYRRNRSTSPLGFATRMEGNGFSYGVTASLNIFTGFLQRRNERNAELQIDYNVINIEKTNKSLEAQLSAAFQTYLVNLDLVGLEEKNQLVAQQNMDITLERYRLGSTTPLEFREAQRNYVDASVRFSNAQYDAKVAEIALKQIAGALTFD